MQNCCAVGKAKSELNLNKNLIICAYTLLPYYFNKDL